MNYYECSQCFTHWEDEDEADGCCSSCVNCGLRAHGAHERAQECCPCSCEPGSECGCDEQGDCCQDYFEAENLGAEKGRRSVRTMSGKPHRPRPLVKDRNLSPQEARTRKEIRAGTFGADDTHFMFYYKDSPEQNKRNQIDEEYWDDWQMLEDYIEDNVSTEEALNQYRSLVNMWDESYPHSIIEAKLVEIDNKTGDEKIIESWKANAENFEAEKGKERVVESKEESGIITKTVQREDKSYDVDKMRASIPKRYRNQVDEDDRLVGAIGVALGVVATIAYQRFTKAFEEWKARRGE